MDKIDREIKEILDRPLPDEAISQHPTKTYLSSIKSIYITERLNEAFGVGSWTVKSKVISENAGAPVVYVTLKIPQYGIKLSQYGGNDNGGTKNKNYDLGDAFKGAMTDGISKIASYLGIGADVYKGKQKASSGNKKSFNGVTKNNKKKLRQRHNGPKASNFIDCFKPNNELQNLGQTPAWFRLPKGVKYIQQQIYRTCNNFY